MNLIILGPPGSGKGTQSRRISLLYDNMSLIDCGSLLRSSPLNQDIKKDMEGGNLIDDSIVCSTVGDEIFRLNSENKNFILDGFPRSIAQCDALFQITDSLELQISCVIKLQLCDSKIFERLSGRLICGSCGKLLESSSFCNFCGSDKKLRRVDDASVDSIKKRISVYRAFEADIIKSLRLKNLMIMSFDASGSVDFITEDIKSQLLIFA